MRLIDADALTEYLKCLFPARGMWEIEGDTAKDAICETVVEAMEMVKNMETIKPKRKRGKWIFQGNRSKTLYGWYFCSECGAYIGGKCNFCSECGADMREVDE